MTITYRGFPLIECARGESVLQAAGRAGYVAPQYRVGTSCQAKPGDGERVVAWAQAGRHSAPIPVFGLRPRYLNADGTIAWGFLKRHWHSDPPRCTEQEREMIRLFNGWGKGRYPRLRRLLAARGEYVITDDDLAHERGATQALADFRAYREDRHTRHSLWARGYKTTSATI